MLRGNLHGDPTLAIERAKTRGVHRTTFTPDDRAAILAANDDLRDRVALRLLLDYGLRKGALQGVQFKHFDHHRKRLTVFTKGGKVRELPIPHPGFWFDLERLILECEAQPHHYLLPRQQGDPVWRPDGKAVGVRGAPLPRPADGRPRPARLVVRLPRAGRRRRARATTTGERMHKARHTAGQRVLDATGNLKAVQKLLGHASIQTTGDIYTDWDVEQLADTLLEAVLEDASEIVPRRPAETPCKSSIYGGGGNRTRVRSRTDRTSTSVVRALLSPAGRFADDLPAGQPSLSVVPPAIGFPLAPSPIVGAPSPVSGRTGWDVA